MPDRPVRIANCSGFYGDRISAARDMLDGPDPIDVLTGDYLAELTMLILWKARQKDPLAGYAKSFLRQMEDVLGTCLSRGVRVVANAGGLNPTGLADRLGELADRLGLAPRVAVVEGDNIVDRLDQLQGEGETFAHLDRGEVLAAAGVKPATANAYLGGWGIAAALGAGADVVICPRVTDAALVVGPAAWWHGWALDDWDRLAGAVVAGHIIECGPQATGGNYPRAAELPDLRYPGFPIAEVGQDGSSVITKQSGTGGVVTVGTVTAQLLYEIGEPAYLNPDVTTHFDTIQLIQEGPDRVLVNGVVGAPPPERLKVAINYPGGYRNSMTMVLTGLDIEEKAARAESMLWEVLGGRDQFDRVDVKLFRSDRPDATTNDAATAELRITVMDADPAKVGRRFSDAVVSLSLASYTGFFTRTPPTDSSAFGVYWPALVKRSAVRHTVRLPDRTTVEVPDPPLTGPTHPAASNTKTPLEVFAGEIRKAPLGTLYGARSGDKGGNANLGLWAWDDLAYRWLAQYLTVDRLRNLVPEAAALEIRRYELPNLRALNFVLVGILGDGVASCLRADPQAKGLGEYVRSRLVDLPVDLTGG